MSPSCFVCSLRPYSPVGLCCIMFLFFLSSLIFSCLLKREVHVGRETVMLTLMFLEFLWERIKKPQIHSWVDTTLSVFNISRYHNCLFNNSENFPKFSLHMAVKWRACALSAVLCCC